MREKILENSLLELQLEMGRARDALTQIEADHYGYPEYLEPLIYEHSAEEALASHLNRLKEMLMVVLDAEEMASTRSTLDRKWKEFLKDERGLKAIADDDERETSHSLPLEYLELLLKSLHICLDKRAPSAQAAELERLEWILEATAMLVHRRGDFPSAELKLQPIMHDYLFAAFPDFIARVRIPGRIKNFEPDCGILGLEAAIEFKIVHTHEDVARAISGVIEDIGGYRGSKDWTRFYSVFYQAHPFMTTSQVKKEIERAGGTTWRPIVVNGLTSPKAPSETRTRKGRVSKSIEQKADDQ